MNLSERLAKAAMERRRQPEASAQPVHTPAMRLPEPAGSDTDTDSGTGTGTGTDSGAEANKSSSLPLWQRPVIDGLRDAHLATVTSLPIQPRDESVDDDRDEAELARAIPMPGVPISEAIIDLDRNELYVPPLAMSESVELASGTLDLRDDIDGSPRSDDTPPPILTQSEPSALPRADDDHYCPQCGRRARLDIHDPIRGRIHLSCDSCFKMWQERVTSTVESDEPFMRD